MTVKATLKSSESKVDLYEQLEEAAQFIRSRTAVRPAVALVLGSGLGGFADELSEPVKVPYEEIPHFARSTAIGHEGRLVVGRFAGCLVVAMQGRFHLYEGYSAQQVAFPTRVFARMGVRAAILTNAAGGINLDYGQGALVVIKDHINLQGQNPLTGPEDLRLGPRFIDMTEAYYKPYRQLALEAGRRLGMELKEGVYAGLLGPSYETPAEIHFLRAIGADLVGMSTIPEVIAARQLGMKVLGISCVTNMAAGVLDKPLNHEEVLETGRRVAGQFKALLREVIPEIASDNPATDAR
jgi:purine-nucleoside phosphorylase